VSLTKLHFRCRK